MITMAVALGTSTPTSITVVETSTSNSPGLEGGHDPVLLVGGSRPCRMPTRRPASGPCRELRGHVQDGERRAAGVLARRPRLDVGVAAVGVPASLGIRAAGLAVVRRVADPRAHHVGLAAGRDLLAHPLPGPVQVVGPFRGRHHVRGDRRPAGRQLAEGGDLEVAEHRHRHRPRDRRRGHHQHVRPGAGRLLAQRVPLLDAEPVLLVDDDQAKVGELDLVLEQGVGADHDPGVAGEHVAQRAAARPHAGRAGQQRHPGRLLGARRAARPRASGPSIAVIDR